MTKTSDKYPKARSSESYLFVYGTLMRGGNLHYLLRSPNVKFIAKGRIRAELYRPKDEGYPGAVLTNKQKRFVHGELYSLRNSQRLIKRLDEEEGCNEGLFVRRLVDVTSGGRRVKAWTYLYAKSLASAKPLASGKFLPVHAVAEGPISI